MFFVLRSAFWLSLVFAALPDAPDMAALSPAQLAQQAALGIQTLCAQDPKACLAALSKVAVLDPAAVPASVAPVFAVPAHPAPALLAKTAAKAPGKKTGTLTASDLSPAWRASPTKL